jgi:type III restriction enzyme
MTDHANVLELDLPEISGRDPYSAPTSHLEKTGANAWSEVSGRRESRTLLANQKREAVNAWRAGGYPGATDTTQRLLTWWFEDDILLPGGVLNGGAPLRGGRHEGLRRAGRPLFQEPRSAGAGDPHIQQGPALHPPIPEINKTAKQELSPENLARYAIKMATGSGKTLVMALLVAWSYLNRRLEAGKEHADNFLLVVPNAIVYERLGRISTRHASSISFRSSRPSGRTSSASRSSCAGTHASPRLPAT